MRLLPIKILMKIHFKLTFGTDINYREPVLIFLIYRLLCCCYIEFSIEVLTKLTNCVIRFELVKYVYNNPTIIIQSGPE